MLATQSEAQLRKQLRATGRPLKELSAESALRLAIEFWGSIEFEGLRANQGDGLVAYFDLIDRGRGTQYEFGVNRILRADPPSEAEWEPWIRAHKLRLSVAFSPTLEVFQLKPAAASFACWSKAQSSEFLAKVIDSAPFRVVASLPQRSSGIHLTECSAPWGEPEHPTQGLSWAVA